MIEKNNVTTNLKAEDLEYLPPHGYKPYDLTDEDVADVLIRHVNLKALKDLVEAPREKKQLKNARKLIKPVMTDIAIEVLKRIKAENDAAYLKKHWFKFAIKKLITLGLYGTRGKIKHAMDQ